MLYYSHVNEDSRVERSLLQSSGCNVVAGVAGSGERLLALMDLEHCNHFYVVDLNEAALFLLQLKLAALKYLDIGEYLLFCGHGTTTTAKRREWYLGFRDQLIPACSRYWNMNMRDVEKGVLHTGHFEKFLSRVRPSVNFIIGNSVRKVLSGEDLSTVNFPVVKWRMLMQVFSARWIYKAWGNKDIAFTGQGACVRTIPAALNRLFIENKAASCFMAHLIFNGSLKLMEQEDVPPSLQHGVLMKIKQKLCSSKLVVEYFHEDIKSFSFRNYELRKEKVFYSLSDILSFENYQYMEELIKNILLPGNRVVWRTFLRNRADSTGMKNSVYNEVVDHSAMDCTNMYEVFSIHKN